MHNGVVILVVELNGCNGVNEIWQLINFIQLASCNNPVFDG